MSHKPDHRQRGGRTRPLRAGSLLSRSGRLPLRLLLAVEVVLLLAGLIVFLNLGGVGSAIGLYPPPEASAPPSTGSVAADGGPWSVYFTTPANPARGQGRGGLNERLAALIAGATASVDVAIYQLDLANVTRALIDAHKRGVSVRIVTDADSLDDPLKSASFVSVQGAGIPVVGGNGDAIMHNKFAIVDQAVVWTGSWNFTENDTYRYNNNVIVIPSTDLARRYTMTFEKMFVEQRFGGQRRPAADPHQLVVAGKTLEVYFTPEDKDATARIVALLNGAQKTINFMAYVFTSDAIGQAVRAAAKRGVAVQGVIEKVNSEAYAGQLPKMQSAGLDVLPDGNSSLMHHKVFIIDEQVVITGSFNFSESAQYDNDENLLIVDDAGIARSYSAEFQRLYRVAKDAGR